jgi:hypothetical protein
MTRWWFALAAAAGAASGARAQTPPGTDVYLARLAVRADRLELRDLRNVTARPGYDNQPQFSPDGRTLYYTSVRDGQADIHRLDLATGRAIPLTATPESEYSATPIPGTAEVAVIRVERDSTQRLWAFPAAGGGEPRLLLERVRPVGYQAWIDPTTVGLFVLGAPATLQVADLASGDARILLSGIGRALQRVPRRTALAVTQLVAENVWWIVEVDPKTAATRPIVRMPDGAEYFVWLGDGSLLSASGRSLLRHRPGRDSAWVRAAELSLPGLGKVTRLAVSPRGDRLALVADEP